MYFRKYYISCRFNLMEQNTVLKISKLYSSISCARNNLEKQWWRQLLPSNDERNSLALNLEVEFSQSTNTRAVRNVKSYKNWCLFTKNIKSIKLYIYHTDAETVSVLFHFFHLNRCSFIACSKNAQLSGRRFK